MVDPLEWEDPDHHIFFAKTEHLPKCNFSVSKILVDSIVQHFQIAPDVPFANSEPAYQDLTLHEL